MRLEFTVSTRQAVPRGAFSTRPSIAGPSRTSSTHRPGVLADRPRDGLVLPVRRTAVTIRRRAASKRASSIDVRRGPRGYASPRLHRSTTARRRRGTWIRRPPHRRDGQQCTSASSYGGKIGSRICDVSGKAGEYFLNPTIDPRKGSTASWVRGPSPAAEVHHEGHQGTRDTTGPAGQQHASAGPAGNRRRAGAREGRPLLDARLSS